MDDNPRQFLKVDPDKIDAICQTIKDPALAKSLMFGIGIHHGGLSSGDRKAVESLFLSGDIQVLVCTATLAWGVNLPAHLVVVKGTEYFDGKQGRYVDFAITDVLQMMGRAGRPQFDDSAVAVILVHEPKKNFYRKFLYEPFPVESQLLKTEVLYNHVNAEICNGAVKSMENAINYLTWTFMWRRFVQNPSYYGLDDKSNKGVQEFVFALLERVLAALRREDCLAPPKEGHKNELTSLPCGKIASRYYISFRTAGLFRRKLVTLKGKISLCDVINLIADAHEYDELPVRHNEDKLNEELAKFCKWPVDQFSFDDPHTKTFLLLQALYQNIKLPIHDYVTDTYTVLQQVPRIANALRDIAKIVGMGNQDMRVINSYVAYIERKTKRTGRE